MIDIFRKLFSLLSGRERKRFAALAVLLVFVALAEIFGLSSLLVLLNVLAEPDNIADSRALSSIYDTLGFETTFNFQIFLSITAFLLILAAQLIKTGGAYALTRFAVWRGYSISSQLLSAYLRRPYTSFISGNSADISRSVLNEVDALVNLVLTPGLKMLSGSILAIGIFIFLLVLDPVITLMAVFMIGGGYALLYLGLRNTLHRLGEQARTGNKSRFRLVQEAAGGFKEMKLLGLEGAYIRRFVQAAAVFADAVALSQILREAPRYIMEALVFAVLLSAVLVMLFQNGGDISAAVPILGTFGFSVLKLLPALQQIYYGVASIRNGKPYLEAIYRDSKTSEVETLGNHTNTDTTSPLSLRSLLDIRNVNYTYPNHDRTALKNLSLSIPARSTVGIVGGSGAGKTTLVDLILGLLTPQLGEIFVDGTQVVKDNLPSWRRSIGYVPQSIFLADSTIAENIAFGIPLEEVDLTAVERAAKLAALHDFVMTDLPNGYQTHVGERGVRLSGGQRQRIGIARALYHDPELLVLDEATSALDNLTEQAVMDAIHNIGHEKTIILIAHRLSTVADCDRILLLEKGTIVSEGTYDELLENSDDFRRMVSGKIDTKETNHGSI